VDVGSVMRSLGGGGHPGAGSALVKSTAPEAVSERILELIDEQDQTDPSVTRIMSSAPPSLPPETSMKEAIAFLEEKRTTVVLVMDQGRLIGLLSSVDCAKVKSQAQERSPVKAFMRTGLRTLSPRQGIREAGRLMANEETGILVVTEEDTVLGVVTSSDLMIHLYVP